MSSILGMIAKVTKTLNLSIIPETSIRCEVANSSTENDVQMKLFCSILENLLLGSSFLFQY